jgi:Protein of unknown function (DUF3302)
MDFLSYFALAVLFFVFLTLAYGMIAIHDIPYHMAKKRNHPHQDAIHYGGWISLFTLHAIWPFLWIWATAYHPEHGYAGRPKQRVSSDTAVGLDSGDRDKRLAELEARLARLETPPEKRLES